MFIYQFKISSKDNAGDDSGAVPLEMANVLGVFYVLCGGSLFALVVAFLVVLVETMKVAHKMKVRLFAETQKKKIPNKNSIAR